MGGIRVIVCGSRNERRFEWVKKRLDEIDLHMGIGFLITGGARGVDTIAMEWARDHNTPTCTFDAHWGRKGAKAGSIRNHWMFKWGEPDAVIVFPGGAGTADCARRAREREVPCFYVREVVEKEEEGD